MSGIDVILDLRQWPRRVRDAEGLTALWADVERALVGTDLSRSPAHRVPLGGGVVGVRLARASGSAVVRADTPVRLVNVLEQPVLRNRCQACSAAEGVFRCADCGEKGWLCAAHAVVLPGSLIGTCPLHRPTCAECKRPATFRCTGPECAGQPTHCDQHRLTQNDDGVPFCPRCFGHSFPECSAANCRNAGGAACEYTDDRLGACGTRMCLTHLRRWQVYGPLRMGLALCGKHETALAKLPPADLVHRVIAGTFARFVKEPRTDPLPTLRGFEYTLRNFRHFSQADDPQWMHRTLSAAGRAFAKAPEAEKLSTFVRQRDEGTGPGAGQYRDGWRKELQDLDAKDKLGQDLVRQAREILRADGGRDGAQLGADLSYGGYVAPRKGSDPRPGRLFVAVPNARRRAFDEWRARLGRELSSRAGVEIAVHRHQGEGRVS